MLRRIQDSLPADSAAIKFREELQEKPQKKEKKVKEPRDTSIVRYSRVFRDTLPLPRMSAISIVVPGFSQLHNKQIWKIPILYGAVGGLTALGINEHNQYRKYRKEFDYLVSINADQELRNPVQNPMIKHNTRRTAFFLGAAATYLYFLGDGVMNHPGATSVQRATTLSMICPGAGQVYNGSFWKVPIVVGGLATMGYIIDFNTRGYNRYKLAYALVSDDNPETIDEFEGRLSSGQLRSLKNNYRRNRDLSMIITAGFYVLNIVDAHVDAHLKDWTVSDDFASIKLYPSFDRLYTFNGTTNTVGMTMSINF